MLHWRLILGALFIGALIGLIALDHSAAAPGAWLLPLALVLTVVATSETLDLLAAAGMRPAAWIVHAGNLAVVGVAWAPWLVRGSDAAAAGHGSASWPTALLVLALAALFAAEIARYGREGSVAANLGGGGFALVYVGAALGLIVQLRMTWGLGALVSFVVVVKMGDIGAYTVGRLVGRHKLAPAVSPGKTIEGFVGQLVFCCAAAWAALAGLTPWIDGRSAPGGPAWNWLLFGVLMAGFGLLGDLAESLLKRQAGRKDSSRWMPGFGGVLDLLDSLLLAAPAAWVFWSLLA